MNNWGDFCTYCGEALKGDFPRACGNGHIIYASPVTVGIALQPVLADDNRTALLVVRRNIEPFKNHLALPGGFVDPGELSRPAAVRELFEETAIRHAVNAAQYFTEITGGSHKDTDPRKHNMYFYAMPVLRRSELDLAYTNPETQSLHLVYFLPQPHGLADEKGNPVTLCFQSHHKAALAFLLGVFTTIEK